MNKNEVVRWTKPPRLIPPELIARKDMIPLRDYAWVYAAPLAFLATCPWWVLSLLWISGPFTLQGWGVTWFVLNCIALVLTAVLSLVRLVSPNTNPLNTKTDAPLNYKGRKKLCQYDANRKRAHQKGERRARYPETDFSYSQFSVWSEPMSNGVQLSIIEHIPRHIGPIHLKYKVRDAAARGRVAKEWFEAPSLEELNEEFTKFELIATKLEDDSYQKVVGVLENHRNALMVRR